MHDVQAEAAYLQVVFHDDDETPRDFVVDLVRSVFSQSAAAARGILHDDPKARQGG
jgi:ATP-dependent Clp protease adapter protein ClpS